MKNKEKKLLNNTFLFMIGNLGSKFIQFFLVPLYTYYLTTTEYGTADLFFTVINFLIPIFSIQISDGFLRFGLDKKQNFDEVITSSFRIMIIGTILSILFSPLLYFNSILKNYVFFFILILNLQIYRDLFSIYLKIKDMNKKFAINNIIYTFMLCLLNFLFLAPFKMGLNGYFLAHIISNILSILCLIISSRFNIKLIFNKANKHLTKLIVIYCLPLIINSISYWITMASDRFMINAMIGISSVGIYAIACKIPTFITTISGIFNQAWMISSIDEFENEKNSVFYSDTFDNYIGITMICSAILILLLKPFMMIYVSPEYYIAWKYTSVLIFSAVFSGICAFINGIFYAYKKNISITITTTLGALINIILNLLLIPIFGILGAAIATLISWIIIAILRIISIKKIIPFKINIIKLFMSTLIITLEIIAIMLLPFKFSFIINLLLTIAIIYIERRIVIKILNLINKKKKNIIKKIRNIHRKKNDLENKKRLKNTDFSIICSNCTAGVIYHNLGQQFRTPTINMYFESKDFIKFCSNLDHYLSCTLVEFKTKHNYPVAKLDDILLYGVHYKDFNEMKNKWNDRKKRINRKNIYYMMTERDGCQYEDLKAFDSLDLSNKIVFTHKKYDDIKCSYYVKGTNNDYDEYHKTKPLTDYKSKISGFRFIDDFDYVDWLNHDNGGIE